MFMKTQREYIDILSKNAKKIREDFGIKSLCIFGSVARNEQNENSDVDICVTMEATHRGAWIASIFGKRGIHHGAISIL